MKKIIVLALTFLFTFGGNVYAIEPEQLITEVNIYKANLYYCDSARGKIVLKNVKPVGTATPQSLATASDAEYNEICITGDGQLKRGEIVPQEYFNVYADNQVRVIIIRSQSEGLRALGLRFL